VTPAAATWLLALAPFATASCLATGEGDDADGEGAFSISVSAAEAARILDLVNYPGVTTAMLDDDAGLDVRAAVGIIAHRDGRDAVATTWDDDRFDSLAELDAIKWVGDAALTRLSAFAAVHAVPPSVTIETVVFQGWHTEAIVWGVNHATLAELDDGLESRAAHDLIAGAPFTSLEQIAAVPYVGPAVLRGLRAESPLWWRRMPHDPHPACDVIVTGRTDATAADLSHLIGIATTADWPFAEVVALAAPACIDGASPPARAALTQAVIESTAIDWGYSPAVLPTVQAPFTVGGARFVTLVDEARAEIDQRVAEGRWAPADDDLALYQRLPALASALTAGPRANPADYAELRLMIEASECSQYATVVLQLSTGRLWVLHDYPRC